MARALGALAEGKMLTNTFAMLRSGLMRTSLTVIMLPPNIAMPLLRIISASSLWSSRATLSCLVLAGLSIYDDDIVVFLALLCKDIFTIDEIGLAEVVGDVSELSLVEAESVLLDHLTGLTLRREN